MKLKRIVSSLLAVVMAFGVVSLATVDENGKIFGNTLTAEAVTEKTATKMPDNAITFSNTYSDELEIIPVASKNGMYYYNNKVIYFTALQTTLSEKFMITTIKADTKTLLSAFMPIPKKASFI